MANLACIFHHPFPIKPGGASGSSVRPYQMLRAFEELGYEVTAVSGYGPERRAAVRRLSEAIGKGKRYDFAYSESHTLPALLTEPHHLPSHPFVDGALFHQVRREGIPLGLFYRDIFWRFEYFKAHYSIAKRHFATFFYFHEWRQIRRFVDHLFLPSLGMASALPSPWPVERMSPLPPAASSLQDPLRFTALGKSETLKLLYVGGVMPPLYDLTPLFDAVGASPIVRLTLCCRYQEWQRVKDYYAVPRNTDIVHADGRDLEPLYERADAVAILRKPNPYLDFAMPVKLFEALGHGLPIVTVKGTEAARFVEREHIGWVLDSYEDLRALAENLFANPVKLLDAYEKVAAVRERHTWKARAEQVASVLTGLKK